MDIQYQQKQIYALAEDYRPTGKPIMTGIKPFDQAMDGGVRGGELVTISGMSGHGKTTFALNLTRIMAESGVPALWFTYEMNPWYLADKFKKMGVDENIKLYIPTKHNQNSMDWIRNHITTAYSEYATKIVFIDHLHYLIPLGDYRNNALTVGSIVRDLKNIAVETDTIIFLIAHMRRLATGEKVNIDAIRDSALIANESDYTYLVERLKKKSTKKEFGSIDDPFESDLSNYAKVQLAKNRRTGYLTNLYFEVKDQDFIELSRAETKELAVTIQL